MGAESAEKSGKLLINEQMFQEISDFLLASKRNALVSALDRAGELSQGKIAQEISSSAASLANIMTKFEQFNHKLLEVKSVGKYRVYSLSDIGKAYVRQAKGRAGHRDEGKSLEKEDEELLKKAEESLRAFELKQGESWQRKFDDAMMRRTCGVGKRLEEKSERLVDEYLGCLERLTLRENDEALDRALRLLPNQILLDRVGIYMDRFDPFLPVMERLCDGKAAFALLEGLRAVFTGEDEKPDKLFESAGLGGREYANLRTAAAELKNCVEGYGKEEIYQYFSALLPDCEALSYSIAGWIRGEIC